jgi:3-oxoacyl-(acyl-carrier-protein) synthase
MVEWFEGAMSGSERRVVVTGFGGITALGHDWPTIERALRGNVSGIVRMGAWDRYPELNTRLGGPVPAFDLPSNYNRKVLRTMGRVAMLATRATEMALQDAGLEDDPIVGSGAMGVAYGSCTGSTDAIRVHAHHRRRERHQCHHLSTHDAAHRRGQHQRVFRHQGSHDPGEQRLHLG